MSVGKRPAPNPFYRRLPLDSGPDNHSTLCLEKEVACLLVGLGTWSSPFIWFDSVDSRCWSLLALARSLPDHEAWQHVGAFHSWKRVPSQGWGLRYRTRNIFRYPDQEWMRQFCDCDTELAIFLSFFCWSELKRSHLFVFCLFFSFEKRLPCPFHPHP